MKQILENMHKHGYILKMFCSADGFSAEFIKDQNIEYTGRRINTLGYLESVLHDIVLVRSVVIVKSLPSGKFTLNYVPPISCFTLWCPTMFAAIKDAASRIKLLTLEEMVDSATTLGYHLVVRSHLDYKYQALFLNNTRSHYGFSDNFAGAVRKAYDAIDH